MKHSIRIDRLALEGEGVGRVAHSKALDGKVAFIPYCLPTETVEAQLGVDKKNYSRWHPLTIQKASPNRIEPACPYFFKPEKKEPSCGGCNWQHIQIGAQRTYKRTLLVESLQRIGGVKDPTVQQTLHTSDEWRFRNKVQVPIRQTKSGIQAGFFAPSSHEVIEFDDCLIQPTLSNRLLKFVVSTARAHQWQGYQEDKHKGWLRHFIVRTNRANQAMIILVARDASFPNRSAFVSEISKAFPEIIGIHQNVQSARTNVILGHHWIRLWGAQYIEESISKLHMQYSPGSFFQVNTPAAERLYEKAIEEAEIKKTDLVVDLFCGVGCLTLLAAQKAKHAVGIEVVSSAVRNAQANARQNNIRNVEFECTKAEDFFRGSRIEWLKSESDNLVFLIDPPRSGCDPRILQALLNLKPKRIVYVSCNPATLARDVKVLSGFYRLVRSTPVDLFPQTAHIESVTKLERVKKDGKY